MAGPGCHWCPRVWALVVRSVDPLGFQHQCSSRLWAPPPLVSSGGSWSRARRAREQLGDMAVTKWGATPRKQHDETSACSLDRARHGGANLRANANSTPDANDRPGRNNNRIPKGRPCCERVIAERWWSAKRGKAVHIKRRSGAHAFNSALTHGRSLVRGIFTAADLHFAARDPVSAPAVAAVHPETIPR
jgi:hypothetical protein